MLLLFTKHKNKTTTKTTTTTKTCVNAHHSRDRNSDRHNDINSESKLQGLACASTFVLFAVHLENCGTNEATHETRTAARSSCALTTSKAEDPPHITSREL